MRRELLKMRLTESLTIAIQLTSTSWIRQRLRKNSVSTYIREVLFQETLLELSISMELILRHAVVLIATILLRSVGSVS